MIGCRVTTLMKIEMIQKEHRMASFWMIRNARHQQGQQRQAVGEDRDHGRA